MNAKPTILGNPDLSSASMQRIRRISHYLKAMVLLYFVAAPLYVVACAFNAFAHGRPADWHLVGGKLALSLGEELVAMLSVVIYLAMGVTFYRLLNLFEKGIFFSPASVRFLRLLGYLAFGSGLLGVVAPVVVSGFLAFPSILLAAIGSPWVAGGLFVIMISHIMDEGCKMREEQDLTV